MRTGMYSVTAGYEEYLKAVLEFQEGESPLAHLTKHEISKAMSRSLCRTIWSAARDDDLPGLLRPGHL